MALISCTDCGREVSSRAPACPHCGNPIAAQSIVDPQFHGKGEGIFMKSLNCGCMVMLGIFAFIILMMFIGLASG
jgi:uncharacterized membrane protein YvbJ